MTRLKLPLLASRVKRAYLLETGEEIAFEQYLETASRIHRFFADLPSELPNAIDTVVCLELSEPEARFDALDTL